MVEARVAGASAGTVYLIPTILAEGTAAEVLPRQVVSVIENTNIYFVEELKTARRFIASLKTGKKIEDLLFYELNKSTPVADIKKYFKDVPEGQNIGIISEAGCPGIADPGAAAVDIAHQLGRTVSPLTGPSSIFLALMASGLNGQGFTFHGYLPIQAQERINRILQIESHASKYNQTQIFMETPYRNNQLLKDLLDHCRPDTKLCVAANITSAEEMIKTKPIKEWKRLVPNLHKQPVIFLLY